MRDMTAKLCSMPYLIFISVIIGILGFMITVFMTRNIGLISIVLMCMAYAGCCFYVDKQIIILLLTFFSSIILAGLAALSSGHILVRFILTI